MKKYYKITSLLIIILLLSCNKQNDPQPVAINNSSVSDSTVLNTTEKLFIGKWLMKYYSENNDPLTDVSSSNTVVEYYSDKYELIANSNTKACNFNGIKYTWKVEEPNNKLYLQGSYYNIVYINSNSYKVTFGVQTFVYVKI